MTRQDAKEEIFRLINYGLSMKSIAIELVIDKIFDEFEAELKKKIKRD